MIKKLNTNFLRVCQLALIGTLISACDSGSIESTPIESTALPLSPLEIAALLEQPRQKITVRDSANTKNYGPGNTIDGDLSDESRWSSKGDDKWVWYNLEDVMRISSVDIAFLHGDRRIYSLKIEVSIDGSRWTEVFSGSSSQQTNEFENFEFNDIDAQYVRITGYGNSENKWNSYKEVSINTVVDGAMPENVFAAPGRIQAEDYHRFNDTTPGNTYGDYRQDDVDILAFSRGPHVTDTASGEWLEYDVNIVTAGNYQFAGRAKRVKKAGGLVVEVNNQKKALNFSSLSWTTKKVNLGSLPVGTHTIRVAFEGNLRFNWFELVQVSANAPTQTQQENTPAPVVVAAPQVAPEPVNTLVPEESPAPEIIRETRLRPGDPGVRVDTSKFDPQYPQMREWAKAGVRGGIPFIDSLDVKEIVNGGNANDINNAINKVSRNGGGAVLLRDGRYRIDRQVTMKKNVSLVGESRTGVEAEIFMNRGNAFFFGSGVTNSGIYRMTIRGSWGRPRQKWNIGESRPNNELPGNENVSIMIKDTTDCWIDGVDILNSADFPIRVNAKHITMRDLNVDGVHNKHGGAHGYFFILDGYNLLTQSRITHLRHISLQGGGVEYNVVYDNDFRQEVSFHSGDDGNNLIEKNRITLPADMPPAGTNSRPDYRAIMGSWSSRHQNSKKPNYIWDNHNVQNNHGGTIVLSGRDKIYHGPLVANTKGQAAEDNWRATNKLPKHGTLYPIVLE